MTDTGLVCATRDFRSERLLNEPNELGPLLETFVINELQKQASWLDKDLVFSHYRDKDKFEVDCIVELADKSCFAVEVKASATLNPSDFKGLKRFKNIAKGRFKKGVLLYCGNQTQAFGEDLIAIPLSALWS